MLSKTNLSKWKNPDGLSSLEWKFFEIKSQIMFKAWVKLMLVYRLSKSQEKILELVSKNLSLVIWIKFWESRMKESVFLTKGCKIKSIKREILAVGCDLQLIIGLSPNFSLLSLKRSLNLGS